MFKRRPLPNSTLFDQDSFYRAFERDIAKARKQLIIESPFITMRRVELLLPVLEKLRRRKVQIIINTKYPEDHEGVYQYQAEEAIDLFQYLGIKVLCTAGHHRKLAIIDGEIIWEGSLNILSFSDSCEIMRRIVSSEEATILTSFIKLTRFIEGHHD